MPYTPPKFNLLANVWTCDGNVKPSNGAADYVDVPCQKYVASRAAWPVTPPWSTGFYLAYHPPVQLRFQHVSPFTGTWRTWKITCVECPAGSGQYYRTFFNDIQHEGFVNEYVLLVGAQCDEDLLATPPAGASEPTGVGADPCSVIPPADPVPPTLPPGPWTPPGTEGESLLDNFNDVPSTPLGLHNADTGQTWTVGTGDLAISGTGDTCEGLSSTPGQHWATVSYAGNATLHYQVVFITPSDLTNGLYVGALYRGTDANNWFAAFLEADLVGHWALSFYQCVSGTPTSMQTGPFFNILSTDTTYSLNVYFDGANVTCQLTTGASILDTQTYVNSAGILDTLVGIWTYCDGTVPSAIFGQVTRP